MTYLYWGVVKCVNNLPSLFSDAGKVDLLKQENRRLQNQLKPSTSKWISTKPLEPQDDAEGDESSTGKREESYDSSDGAVPSPTEPEEGINLAQELAAIEGAPRAGRLGRESSTEDALTDHDDSAEVTRNAGRGHDKGQGQDRAATIKRSQSMGPSLHRSRSFTHDPAADSSTTKRSSELGKSWDKSQFKDNDTNSNKDEAGVKHSLSSSTRMARSSSLADLTAPRPYRRSSSAYRDDDDDDEDKSDEGKKHRPSLKERLAMEERKYEDEKFSRDLQQKIQARKHLLNVKIGGDSDTGGSSFRSRRSTMEKSDSDSDRPSSYAKRREMLLKSASADTGRGSSTAAARFR